ncbi:hypothetical protein VTN00DRAFT_2368 [Thermoascus crustaceus]|uniref:uncharacterized protein n=1 Tax=Thermoascus crustaceus TaxID=5088 RepID=UPI0037445608
MLPLVFLAFLSAIYIYSIYKRRARLPLPPGPPSLPLIGNLHQAPQSHPWRTYQEWNKKYGPIVSVKFGQRTCIILGTHEAAHDLLVKRSSIYSSRPRSVVAGESITKGLAVVFMPYGEKWKLHHRVQGSLLSSRMVQRYHVLQDVESKQLLHELLSTNDFASSFHRYSCSLLFALAYGKRIVSNDEREIHELDAVASKLVQVAYHGGLPVDVLPVLNFLPRCLARWKRIGDELHSWKVKLHRENMAKGRDHLSWNWCKEAMKMKETKDVPWDELSYIVGFLYDAGSETTTIALEVAVFASVLHPEAVKKAQQELDAIFGQTRLPNFEDLPELPYINAFVNEVLRWRPVAPNGIPHAVIRDDEYMGYRIPKDAAVIANNWSLDLDEKTFEDPHAFRPERWLENPDLPLGAFGFGRRACPGKSLAVDSLKIIIARLLWAYDIGYAYRDGKEVAVDPWDMTDHVTSRPAPFEADIRVRSPAHQTIVETAWSNSEKETHLIFQHV